MKRPNFWLFAACAILGIGLGAAITTFSYGERRDATPKATFKAGGERSELILIGISQKLDLINSRLERIERAITVGNPVLHHVPAPVPQHVE